MRISRCRAPPGKGGWVDAVKSCFRGFNRLVGEIGVRGPLQRLESQGCDEALTNSGSLKPDTPPWTFSWAVSEWPSPSGFATTDDRLLAFPSLDTTLQLDISSKLRFVSVLCSLSRSRRYMSWPSPTQTASSDATHRDCTLQDSQRPVIGAGLAINGIWFTRLKVVMRRH